MRHTIEWIRWAKKAIFCCWCRWAYATHESSSKEALKIQAQHPLPLVGEEGCWEHPHVKQLQDLATEMDGYILTSPEYHGTMSGVMKNTLDWLYNKHVGGKAFALMSTLGGMTNSNTLNHMRISVRWLGGWCVPQQIAVGKVKNAFSDDGSLVDDELTERMESMVDALVGMCRHLKGA